MRALLPTALPLPHPLFSWRLALLALLLWLAGARPLAADTLRQDGRYDPAIPAPASILGFEIGERPARHDQILRTLGALAAAAPGRARLELYGRTAASRDLVVLVVTSEENLARLDDVKESIRLLADPRLAAAPGHVDRLLASTPAVAYLAYGIHGDEESSSDAALRLAYELVAGQTDDVQQIRDRLVVLIDPAENPDGRERMLGMSASFQGSVPSADPDSMAHSGLWPWGRGNHYLFDLNRDWFALVQPESQGRAALLQKWRPQLVVDSHEMGSDSTYLFSPARAPFNPNLPTGALARAERFAADQAAAFDRHGWSYYTREWNEEFFPGYGSSLVQYQGGLGILYEQAGSQGQPVRRLGGTTLQYQDAVAHHFVSSLANLRTAAAHREELLRDYRRARAEAIARGREGPARAYYFAPHDPGRAARLATRLASLGIEVERLAEGGPLPGARSPWQAGPVSVQLLPGTFRVRLDQPDGLLARAVLEPHTPMPDSFLAEEREHLERQKGTRVYDVTAWSPLLAAGLDVWWTAAADGLRWEPVSAAAPPTGGVGEGTAAFGWVFDGGSDGAVALAALLLAKDVKLRLGEKPFELAGRAFPRGSFLVRAEENGPNTGYLLRKHAVPLGVEVFPTGSARIAVGPDLGGEHWVLLEPPRIAVAAGFPTSFTGVGWAWHLLDRELGTRMSLLDVSALATLDLARYNVLVLPDADGDGSVYRRALGDEGLKAIRTWVEAGGTLVAAGAGADFVADAATKLSQVRLRRQALKDFPAPRFGLDDRAVRALERLQATGLGPEGKPVASAGLYAEQGWPAALGIPGAGSPVLGPGASSLMGVAPRSLRPADADAEAGPRAAGHGKDKGSSKDTGKPAKPGPAKAVGEDGKEPGRSEDEETAALEKVDARLRRFLPGGAIVRVDLDPEQWLAYGVGERVAVMAAGQDALIARDPVVTAGRYAAPAELHLGGLLWPEAVGRMSQTAYVTREEVGRGQVVLFAGDPNFRGYFWGSERLFLNAVVLGPGAGTRRGIPW